MLVANRVLNNITAHRLFTAHCKVLSNNYCYQTTNNFEKFLDLESKDNTSMIIAPILLVLHMHIRLTKFLKDSVPNVEFDADKRLRTGSTGLNWDNSAVAEATAVVEDNEDEEEDLREKNR